MIESSNRVLMILHLSLMASVAMYLVVLNMLSQNQAPKGIEPVFLYALAGVAAMVMLLIPVLRRKLLPPLREAHSLDEKVVEGPAVQQALQRVHTTSIISWALCESIAIWGFLLSFLSMEMKYFLAFGAVSLVNFILYRPRKELLLAAARAAQ